MGLRTSSAVINLANTGQFSWTTESRKRSVRIFGYLSMILLNILHIATQILWGRFSHNSSLGGNFGRPQVSSRSPAAGKRDHRCSQRKGGNQSRFKRTTKYIDTVHYLSTNVGTLVWSLARQIGSFLRCDSGVSSRGDRVIFCGEKNTGFSRRFAGESL